MLGDEEFDEEKFEEAEKYFLDSENMTELIDDARKRARWMLNNRYMLLDLISYIDLTTLNGDDTDAVVQRVIDKALQPYPAEPDIGCAAVCVYPARVVGAKRYVLSKERNLPVGAAAAGFPSGQYRIESKIMEVNLSITDGADEIDVVISRDAALEQDWRRVYKEIAALKKACGQTCMKTILATGELRNEPNIYRASWASMLAGSDFIKTSTGKENVNATLQAACIMCEAIRQFKDVTGKKVGFKAAGGIRTASEALEYRALVEEILGPDWLTPKLFRIGASSLLDSIVDALSD